MRRGPSLCTRLVRRPQRDRKIDGKLDDAAWQNATSTKDFIINFPDFGKPSSQNTDVKIVYDDEAIYVAAYMHDDPKLIRRQLPSRWGLTKDLCVGCGPRRIQDMQQQIFNTALHSEQARNEWVYYIHKTMHCYVHILSNLLQDSNFHEQDSCVYN